MQSNADILHELIHRRRSVFTAQFIPGAKVDDAIVNELLENARWAPNHGRQEPWQFVVFTGQGLERLARFQAELYKQEAGENFLEKKYQKLLSQPLLASHVIAICMKRTVAKSIPETEDISAVACAVQNMYLTATAYGIGAYWSTGGITYYLNAKPFFGLEEQDRLMGFFFVGQIAEPSAAGTRKPLNEKVKWVTE
jgi:nitroreductase